MLTVFIAFDIFLKQKINYYSIIFRVFFFLCFAKIFGFSFIFLKLILDFIQFIKENFSEKLDLFFLSRLLEIILKLYFKIIFKLIRPLLRGFNYNYSLNV